MPPDGDGNGEGEWANVGTGDWSAQAALADMERALTRAGLVCPIVPAPLAGRLAVSAESRRWAWGTSDVFESWAVYETPGAHPPRLLAADTPDLFLFAHRGHGINSYRLGLIARYGPVAVFQQVNWGGVYMDREQSVQAANRASESWSTLVDDVDRLEAAGERQFDELRCAVVFSNTTPTARLLERSPLAAVVSEQSSDAAIRWIVVADLEADDVDAAAGTLENVAASQSPRGAAARHLQRLVAGAGGGAI